MNDYNKNSYIKKLFFFHVTMLLIEEFLTFFSNYLACSFVAVVFNLVVFFVAVVLVVVVQFLFSLFDQKKFKLKQDFISKK